jgi:hypothetical protein
MPTLLNERRGFTRLLIASALLIPLYEPRLWWMAVAVAVTWVIHGFTWIEASPEDD